MPSSSATRLSALRNLLKQNGLDGLIIPHSDEFLGNTRQPAQNGWNG